ncbi:MAG: peptidylprolyl isomerase [Verrucomicrobiae bacterium]|nr:peptidylprolyl isomerase [Verrucomicrobiae bacterium]
MKKRTWIFAALLMTAGLALTARAELQDGIAALVNDDVITFSDVKLALGSTEEELSKSYRGEELITKIREARRDALNSLVERRLIIQDFKKRGGKIPENVIEDEINAIIDEHYNHDRSLFVKTLEALGLTLESFKDRINDKLIVRFMQQREISGDHIIISPYKIEQYYKEHTKDFSEGEKVKLRMIYIKKVEGEADDQRKMAQEILTKLNTGTDFAELAKIYSEDSKAKEGGDYGFIGRDTLRPELADSAFTLKVGHHSPVIETPDGFYIMQVVERKDAKVTSMADARDMIERLLVSEERKRLQEQWIQRLKRRAYIRTF